MATANNYTERELRKPTSRSNTSELKEVLESDETNGEIIKIPGKQINDGSHEPGPITKQKMISLLIVMFSVFLDFMGASIVQPILPFYAEKFNASSTQLGALYSSYSFMSLCASFFMGKCSDIYGRKPMILFSLFGTCVGFLSSGLANNYAQLLGSRFLTGFFGATAPVAMAVITDTVPSVSRPKYLAATGAVITLSFIIGPGLGAGLAEFGIRVPFFVSSGLGAFGVIFALILLKESHPTILRKRSLKQSKITPEIETVKTDHDNVQDTDDDAADDELDRIKIVKDDHNERTDLKQDEVSAKIPIQVWIMYTVNILRSFASTVYISMFALYVIDVYNLSSLSVGYITLCLAVMLTFGNVIFVKLSKHIGIYITAIIGCFVFASALFIVPFVKNIWLLLAIVVFGFGGGTGLIIPTMTASVASFTNYKNRGIILGLSTAAQNIGLIIGPLLNGILYGINRSYPFYAGAVAAFIGGLIVIIMICIWTELKYPEKKDDVVILPNVENWRYIADRATKTDYMRLGKAFGVMLSDKEYQWVTRFDELIKVLDTMFPPLRADTLEHRREDLHFIVNHAKETRLEFDDLRWEYANKI